MDAYIKLKFKNLCRLCISFSHANQNIFEGPSDLNLKILDCLSIKVEENDPLPRKICQSCLDKVESFNDFRLACVNAESTLKSYYSLFKTNIDNEGTIFVKVNEAELSLVQADLTTKNSSNAISKELKNDKSEEKIKDVAGKQLYLERKPDVFGNKRQLVTDQLPPTEELLQNRPLAFNLASEMALPIDSVPSTLPAPCNNDSLSILNLNANNRSNSLNFIDSSSTEFRLDACSKRNEGLPPVALSANNVSKLLSSPNEVDETRNDNIILVKISELLNEVYSEGESGFYYDKVNEKFTDVPEISSNVNLHENQVPAAMKDQVLNVNNLAAFDEMLQVPSAEVGSDTDALLKRQFIFHELQTSDEQFESLYTKKEACQNAAKAVLEKTNEQIVPPVNHNIDSNASPPFVTLNQNPTVEDVKQPSNNQDWKSASETNPKKVDRIKYKCTSCSKCFITLQNFLKHEAKHTELEKMNKPEIPEVNICPVCNISFSTRMDYNAHIKSHEVEGIKAYKCDICQKLYKKQKDLNRHVKNVHNSFLPAEEFKCPICFRSIKSKEGLRRHVSTHNRSYSCELCEATFNNKASLNRHKAKCPCNVLFKCEPCGIEFSTKILYDQHINNNDCKRDLNADRKICEYPIECDIRNVYLETDSILKSHLESHDTTSSEKHLVKEEENPTEMETRVNYSLENPHSGSPSDKLTLFGNGVSVEMSASKLMDKMLNKHEVRNRSEKLDCSLPNTSSLRLSSSDIQVQKTPSTLIPNLIPDVSPLTTDRTSLTQTPDKPSLNQETLNALSKYLKSHNSANLHSTLQPNKQPVSRFSSLSNKNLISLLNKTDSTSFHSSSNQIAECANERDLVNNNRDISVTNISKDFKVVKEDDIEKNKHDSDVVSKIAKNLEIETKPLLNLNSTSNANVYEFTLDSDIADRVLPKRSFRRIFRNAPSSKDSTPAGDKGTGFLTTNSSLSESDLNNYSTSGALKLPENSLPCLQVEKASNSLPPSHNFLEVPSLENLIAVTEPYLEGEFNNLIKEAVETLVKNPSDTYTHATGPINESNVEVSLLDDIKDSLPSGSLLLKNDGQVDGAYCANSNVGVSRHKLNDEPHPYIEELNMTKSVQPLSQSIQSILPNSELIKPNPCDEGSHDTGKYPTSGFKFSSVSARCTDLSNNVSPAVGSSQKTSAMAASAKDKIFKNPIEINNKTNTNCQETRHDVNKFNCKTEKSDCERSKTNNTSHMIVLNHSGQGKSLLYETLLGKPEIKKPVDLQQNVELESSVKNHMSHINLNESVSAGNTTRSNIILKSSNSLSVSDELSYCKNMNELNYCKDNSEAHLNPENLESQEDNSANRKKRFFKKAKSPVRHHNQCSSEGYVVISKTPFKRRKVVKNEGDNQIVSDVKLSCPMEGVVSAKRPKLNQENSISDSLNSDTLTTDSLNSNTLINNVLSSDASAKDSKLSSVTSVGDSSTVNTPITNSSDVPSGPIQNNSKKLPTNCQESKFLSETPKSNCCTETPLVENQDSEEPTQGSPSSSSDSKGAAVKPPLKTIRIHLERFDPDKLSQYLNKKGLGNEAQDNAKTQPYNLRKSKENQTCVCSMEDS